MSLPSVEGPPERPRLPTPSFACDCHVHVYDPAVPPAVAGASPGPAWATAARYRALQERLGLERAVLVQANAYGFDNAVTARGIAELGRERTRGVAIVGPDTDDAGMARLTEAGFCGARLHMLGGGILAWDDLDRVAARAAAFGWHVQLQLDGRTLHEREAQIRRWPGTLVIDHIGKFLEPVGLDHPGFRALLRLLEGGRTYLKLSGPYEVSRSGAPDYADVALLAKAALRHAPERMVWASNWPHIPLLACPSDAALLDLLADWAPDEAERRAVLVDNAARLYGFASAE